MKEEYEFDHVEEINGNDYRIINSTISEFSNYANQLIKRFNECIKSECLSEKDSVILSQVCQRATNIMRNSPENYLKKSDSLKKYELFLNAVIEKMEKIILIKFDKKEEKEIHALIKKTKDPIVRMKNKIKSAINSIISSDVVQYPIKQKLPLKDEKIPDKNEEEKNDEKSFCERCCSCVIL
jgi:hypothetical protein